MAVPMTAQPRTEPGGSPGLSVTVSKRYGAFELSVNLVVEPGITVLFGASGAGKSTLLDCIAGLTNPDSGTIYVSGGVDVWFLSAGGRKVNVPCSQRHVGYVFQDLALFPHLSARENIEYGLAKLPAGERDQRVETIAKSFGISELLSRRPAELSGGQRQRVALARTLVTRPRVLLLDEPLAGLDAPTRSRLMQDLRAWNAEQKIPILLVTHSREEVFALAEKVVVLENGHVVAQGTPEQALEAAQRDSIASLAGYENIFDAEVAALHPESGTMTCRIAETKLSLEAPLGRVAEGAHVRIGIRAGDILLATAKPEHISARNVLRGTVKSLDQVDVTVTARVDCGAVFDTHLTPGARDSLALAVGREVWLVVKTHSCRVWYE
jgi:molybdate transport system ATP-binding protein